jgi:paraquat-inducible protein B
LIRRGLRGQLRQGNLLTGQLYVALDFGPAEPPPDVPAPSGVLRIPTAPSSFTEIQTTLANLAKKLEQLPLDGLARDLRATLTTLKSTLTRTESLLATAERDLAPEVKTNLAELRKTLQTAQTALAAAQSTMEGAQGLFASDAPVQTDLREMLREVARSAEALRHLAETLERQPEALLRGRSEGK